MAVTAHLWNFCQLFPAYLKQTDRLAVLLTCLVLAGACYSFNIVYLVALHPLRHIPGPLSAKTSNRWQSFHAARLQKAEAVHGQCDIRSLLHRR